MSVGWSLIENVLAYFCPKLCTRSIWCQYHKLRSKLKEKILSAAGLFEMQNRKFTWDGLGRCGHFGTSISKTKILPLAKLRERNSIPESFDFFFSLESSFFFFFLSLPITWLHLLRANFIHCPHEIFQFFHSHWTEFCRGLSCLNSEKPRTLSFCAFRVQTKTFLTQKKLSDKDPYSKFLTSVSFWCKIVSRCLLVQYISPKFLICADYFRTPPSRNLKCGFHCNKY